MWEMCEFHRLSHCITPVASGRDRGEAPFCNRELSLNCVSNLFQQVFCCVAVCFNRPTQENRSDEQSLDGRAAGRPSSRRGLHSILINEKRQACLLSDQVFKVGHHRRVFAQILLGVFPSLSDEGLAVANVRTSFV